MKFFEPMPFHMYKGEDGGVMNSFKTQRFIAFEGIDGAGKTTFVNEIYRWLRDDMMQPAIKTSALSEGSTDLGKEIGDILRNKKHELIDPISEVLMIAAARRDNWTKIIAPALYHNTWVISDRHIDSMYCYQDHVDQYVMNVISDKAKINVEASLTFIIDLPPDDERIKFDGTDRMEWRVIEWWEECRYRFLARAARDKSYTVIDNRKPLSVGFEKVKNTIVRHFKELHQYS